MLISQRIFLRLNEMGLSQKDFSERTGIPQSTISEWKKKGTNPSSEKIMVICNVLEVSPEWLLSGAEIKGNNLPVFVIDKESEEGEMIDGFNRMTPEAKAKLVGYMEALIEMDKRLRDSR